MSLRGAKRRGNPFSLQQHKTKSNSSRQIRRSCEFALCTTVLPGISAGTRIAAPVCALVRNDMQKAVACQRLQGVVRNDMLKTDTCQRLQGRGAQGARKHAGCQRLQGRFGSTPAVLPCTRRYPANFCMSLRGAKRRGNPYSLRQYMTESNFSRRIRIIPSSTPTGGI